MNLTLIKPKDNRTPEELSDSIDYLKNLKKEEIHLIGDFDDFVYAFDSFCGLVAFIGGKDSFDEKISKDKKGFEITEMIFDERFIQNSEFENYVKSLISRIKITETEEHVVDKNGNFMKNNGSFVFEKKYGYVLIDFFSSNFENIEKKINELGFSKINEENKYLKWVNF